MATAVWQEDALRRHVALRQSEAPGRYLYRGQRRRYPKTLSTIARAEGAKLGQAYTILRRFVSHYPAQILKSQMRGLIKATPEEVIALLQHHGWPTPYIDLTDDIDVALFFAHDDYKPDDGDSLLFVVDTAALPSHCIVVGHHEVVDPDLNIRWSKQKGHALRPIEWRNLDHCRSLDLLRTSCVEVVPFRPSIEALKQTAQLKPHYYMHDKEIADQLKFLVLGIAEMCGMEELHPDLLEFPF